MPSFFPSLQDVLLAVMFFALVAMVIVGFMAAHWRLKNPTDIGWGGPPELEHPALEPVDRPTQRRIRTAVREGRGIDDPVLERHTHFTAQHTIAFLENPWAHALTVTIGFSQGIGFLNWALTHDHWAAQAGFGLVGSALVLAAVSYVFLRRRWLRNARKAFVANSPDP